MRKLSIFPCLFAIFSLPTTAQFKVNMLVQIPSAPAGDSIFVAGNFNGWNPAASNYRLQFNNKNKASVQFSIVGTRLIEFKFTRGNWQQVECDINGREIENRVFKIESDTTLTLSVAAWKDNFAPVSHPSTASKNVLVVDTAFYMPQLNTRRTLRVYLPPGYAFNKQRYPVLYMHDGQNLFDETLNPFGEWGVDEYLDSAKKKCIVVAIDHGGSKRLNEYNPYNNNQFGKGLGKEYTTFLVKTLKPYIDRHFRTKAGRAFTSIAGSSMGAHISFYAALNYPNVFGNIGILSPAFWINYAEVETEIKKATPRKGQRYFFYAGQLESDKLMQEVIGIFNQFNKKLPGNATKLSLKAMGKHNEQSWRKVLPEFFGWL
jgi:predicted alpha/beta superfamily hydrolase